MIGMRKLVGFLMALAFVALALPAAAHGNDTINLTMGGGGGTNQLTASIKHNDVGDIMKSFTLKFGTNVQGVSGMSVSISPNPPSTAPTVSVTGSGATGLISVTGLKLSSTQTLKLTFTVTSSAAGCGSTTSTWTGATGWDGASFNGEKYPLASTGNNLNVSFTPLCATATSQVSASGDGSGTISPASITVLPNTSATFAVSPATGSSVSVSDSCGGPGANSTTPGTFNYTTGAVPATGCTVTATFTLILQPVTTGTNGTGSGLIAGPAAVKFSKTGQYTLTPDVSSDLTSVSSPLCAGGNPVNNNNGTYTYTTGAVPVGGCTVTGTFTKKQFSVTTNKSGPGTITGPFTADYGVSPIFTVTPDANGSIVSVAGAGCTVTKTAGDGQFLQSTYTTTAGVTGPCTVTATFVADGLAVTLQPTSVAFSPSSGPASTFDVTVSSTPGGAIVTPNTAACGGATWTPLTGSGTSTTFTFTMPTAAQSSISVCTIAFSAPNYAGTSTSAMPLFAVGSLACGPLDASPGDPNTIVASAPGVTSINDPGFAEGVRGSNTAVNKDGITPNLAPCVSVNWTFTNNVLPNPTPIYDAKGNLIPVNGVSFVWDQTLQPNAAYSYSVTWQPEWFGLASLNNRKTQFCNSAAPNACATTVLAQSCLSPLLERSSIPTGAPACVSAEVWAVVPLAKCTGAVPPLPAPDGDQNACVVFTTTITDIKDPPIIRP